MFTTAVQAGPNGSRDLPIPFPKSQCVRSNSQRPAYEVGVRPHETSAHPTGSASGSQEQKAQEKFMTRQFMPPGKGSPIAANTIPSKDNSAKLTSVETRLRC